MKKHKALKEREEAEFQYSGSDDEGVPETDERAGQPSSILQVICSTLLRSSSPFPLSLIALVFDNSIKIIAQI